MRRIVMAAAAVALAIPAVISGAGTAAAATGRVVVFETEFQQLTVYEDPSGCHKLPVASHVLVNLTDATVRTYGDPLCLTPSLIVQPGFGTHVAPLTGSFSVE
ncbi:MULTISPECIES: hypothetical protein [Amycolatopsis]|uniref:Secreted protein n=1 Tax=Amycolatopsis thermalba TaxID=944492 RepID=A0ABY4NXI7_9PSEU|nr:MULTISPECIES: hypothetical protein [Amycolatopsis]UQS24743.1 hypothetical protein L1857_18915 [Amycolatopsis thermalba]